MPLPQLVTATRRTAKHHLKKCLPDFFSQVDDSLFALADKAENNQLQNLYFDAMREVRLKKDDMSKAYRRQLDALFDASLSGEPLQNGQPGEQQSLEQAGLVDDQQLEESLALTNMISAADLQNREALYGLTARLDFLIESQDIDKDNNPLRPEVICHAFTAAVDELSGDLKVRLVIYKLFDKHIAQHLGDMYAAINADLIAAGVLPRLKTPAQKSAEEKTDKATTENEIIAEIATAMTQQEGLPQTPGNGAATASENLFTSLQTLLSQHRAAISGATGTPTGAAATGGIPMAGIPASAGAMGGANNISGEAVSGPTGTVVGETDGPANAAGTPGAGVAHYYAPQDIVSALSGLQTSVITTTGTAVEGDEAQNKQGGVMAAGQASATVIKANLVQAMSQQAGDGEERQLGQADTDAIDIVSLLFDFILDDPHIADDIKGLIARLQIPILKVAIIDKEFFAKKHHPARLLLNELAHVDVEDMSSDDSGENPALQMVEYVVERIINEFEDDPKLFTTLLEEFTLLVEEEREANRLAEEMLEQARDTAANEIRQRLEEHSVPPFVRALLIDAWRDVLNHIYLRDGSEGVAWNTALQVADDLIWSVQPKLVVADRQELIRIIPRVLNGLRDGLTLIAYDRDVTERIFEKLEELHLASLRGGLSAVQTTPAEAAQDATPSPEAADTTADANDPSPEPQSPADEFIEEIILASTQAMDWDGWEQLDSEHAETVKDMALDTWVEFIDGETGKSRRGKLTWKCDFTGEYTFVDRKYKVVADLNFTKLLEEFDAGRAHLIEDVPLFDRALDSVINGFKRALEGRSSPAEEAMV